VRINFLFHETRSNILSVSYRLNGILHDFLLQNTREPAPPIPTSQVLSPWDADLRQNGWDPEEEEADETVI